MYTSLKYYNIVYCDKWIHDELDEVMCPFCDKQIKERSVIVEKLLTSRWLWPNERVL